MTKAAEKTLRVAEISRTTKETDVLVRINLDQPGECDIETSLPFLSHMLNALACHARFSLMVRATGDIEVDPHHLIEDTGIVLGESIFKALGGLSGIQRAGCFSYPMDGTLASVAIDLCGRRNLTWHAEFSNFCIGNLDPNLFREFYKGFVDGLRATLHVNLQYRDNDHHAVEAIFKATARALKEAVVRLDDGATLSTKGMLDES
ncbi:MAG TPA: imidazoleglycerol-phosphate dehydratase [Candidatus Obscuribacterales bacterium]